MYAEFLPSRGLRLGLNYMPIAISYRSDINVPRRYLQRGTPRLVSGGLGSQFRAHSSQIGIFYVNRLDIHRKLYLPVP